jgi:hypothetical protein
MRCFYIVLGAFDVELWQTVCMRWAWFTFWAEELGP